MFLINTKHLSSLVAAHNQDQPKVYPNFRNFITVCSL